MMLAHDLRDFTEDLTRFRTKDITAEIEVQVIDFGPAIFFEFLRQRILSLLFLIPADSRHLD